MHISSVRYLGDVNNFIMGLFPVISRILSFTFKMKYLHIQILKTKRNGKR